MNKRGRKAQTQRRDGRNEGFNAAFVALKMDVFEWKSGTISADDARLSI